jgi:hypothetical protein
VSEAAPKLTPLPSVASGHSLGATPIRGHYIRQLLRGPKELPQLRGLYLGTLILGSSLSSLFLRSSLSSLCLRSSLSSLFLPLPQELPQLPLPQELPQLPLPPSSLGAPSAPSSSGAPSAPSSLGAPSAPSASGAPSAPSSSGAPSGSSQQIKVCPAAAVASSREPTACWVHASLQCTGPRKVLYCVKLRYADAWQILDVLKVNKGCVRALKVNKGCECARERQQGQHPRANP